ncbi:hypothetical protein, partial [Paraburkholderia sabiae]
EGSLTPSSSNSVLPAISFVTRIVDDFTRAVEWPFLAASCPTPIVSVLDDALGNRRPIRNLQLSR